MSGLFTLAKLFNRLLFILILSVCVVFYVKYNDWHFLNSRINSLDILFIPILIFSYGFLNISIAVSNRFKNYKTISSSKLLQTFFLVLVQVGLGFVIAKSTSLLVGILISTLVGIFILRRNFSQIDTTIDVNLRQSASKYKNFLIFDGPPSVLNSLMLNIPYFVLPIYYSVEVVGSFFFMQKIIYTPLSLFAISISKVNQRKINERLSDGLTITRFYLKLMISLLLIAVLPMLFIFLYGDVIFVFIFGQDWQVAGKFATIISLPLVIQFTASSLSTTLFSTNGLRLSGSWKIIAFSAMLLVYLYFPSKVAIFELIKIHAITLAFVYSLYLAMITYSVFKADKSLINEVI